MQTPRRVLILVLGILTPAVMAQVRIVSNAPDGVIRWTNLVTASAVYRVEWAVRPNLQWRALGVVTNQTWIATSNMVAQLPLVFLRVVWTNATSLFELNAFDSEGNLVATGWLNGGGCSPLSDGAWTVFKAGGPTSRIWPVIAVGKGCYVGNLETGINLNPETSGNQVLLESPGIFQVESNVLVGAGEWRHAIPAGTGVRGTYRVAYRGGIF